MYNMIKRFYNLGLWTEPMVKQALDKKLITQAEYDSIVKKI